MIEFYDLLAMQSPEIALARSIEPAGNLDEAIVEGEIVSQGVLPFLGVRAVVGKMIGDELGERRRCFGLHAPVRLPCRFHWARAFSLHSAGSPSLSERCRSTAVSRWSRKIFPDGACEWFYWHLWLTCESKKWGAKEERFFWLVIFLWIFSRLF